MTAEGNTAEHDPERPAPPAREPPHRTTAPQSEFTPRQAGIGFLVLFVGVALIVGLALGLS
jgi:uncharacterized protein HemX